MIKIVDKKISVDELLSHVEDHSTGAVVLFLGRVRNQAEGRQVNKMAYEAYDEMALAKMREIENDAKNRWPIRKISMVQRTGNLQLGEVSVAIAVATAHRKDAFEAGRFCIDTLKETVPIWKKEYFVDNEAWVEGVVPKNGGKQKP